MSEEPKAVPAAAVSYRRHIGLCSAAEAPGAGGTAVSTSPLDPSAALARHAVTHQAAGILMIQQHCGAAEALELLSTAAARAEKRIDEVAAGIVANVQRRDKPGRSGRY